jgi:hypothetical protein
MNVQFVLNVGRHMQSAAHAKVLQGTEQAYLRVYEVHPPAEVLHHERGLSTETRTFYPCWQLPP